MMAARKLLKQTLASGRVEVSFSPGNRQEIEDAKSTYRRAREQGRRMLSGEVEVKSFRDVIHRGYFMIEAERAEDLTSFAFHIFDESGDRRPMWRADRPDEVQAAALLFKEYIDKGWKAYAVSRLDPQARGLRVYEFDPLLEEVIFDDRTTLEKLKGFPEKLGIKDQVTQGKERIRANLKKFAEQLDEIKLLPKTFPG